jgi:D-beta-D-heptose 7-phosphate kinase/D-beta-D-heptose 1-phosphate adenosyltransferase
MDALLKALEGWREREALVVGDFMLDELTYGDAERLSPDAPVPILRVRRTEHRAGGAANVCLDLAALKVRVRAVGVVGADAPGRLLRDLLRAGAIDDSGVCLADDRPTTRKQSLIGLAQARHPQKMFRVDYESRNPLPPEIVADLCARVREGVEKSDFVCIEDYGKGVCSPEVCRCVIEEAHRAGKPVFVDPARGADYAKYRGASAITPNRTEAEEATGLPTAEEGDADLNARLARALVERLDLDACVLTLDRHGALLLERGGSPVAVPTVARQVYDVTGAGDMFLAALAAAHVNGCSWLDATRFANTAAGLEVEVFGVEPIPLERVHHALLREALTTSGKVRTLEQAVVEARVLRAQGRRIVFTNGCFDVLHSGHVHLLEQAAAMGDFLVVGLNSDASVRRLKGPHRPINTAEDRARVLGALACVGVVVVFDEDTPLRLIKSLRPDVLVKGADYTRRTVVGADVVESYGGRVVLVPLVEGRSTTGTLQRMRSGEKD